MRTDRQTDAGKRFTPSIVVGVSKYYFYLLHLDTSDNVGCGNQASRLESIHVPTVHGTQLRQQRRQSSAVRVRQRKLPTELHRCGQFPQPVVAASSRDAERRPETRLGRPATSRRSRCIKRRWYRAADTGTRQDAASVDLSYAVRDLATLTFNLEGVCG